MKTHTQVSTDWLSLLEMRYNESEYSLDRDFKLRDIMRLLDECSLHSLGLNAFQRDRLTRLLGNIASDTALGHLSPEEASISKQVQRLIH